MNQLTTKLIEMVLNNLNFKDKMNCRLVNKKFKSIIDNHLKFDELIISEDVLNFYDNWFFTNKPKNRANLIFGNFSPNDPFKKSIFGRIKKLCVNVRLDIDKTINKLNQLEELEISARPIKNGQIKLANLIILLAGFRGRFFFQLNTPNLSIFRSHERINSFDFVYPEKIKYLELKDNSIDNLNITLQFINLEYLVFHQYSVHQQVLLTNYKKLKEIHFIAGSDLAVLQRIYAEKKRMKLKNLKLFLSGLEFEFFQYFESNITAYNNNIFRNTRWLRNFNSTAQMILKNYSKSIDIYPFLEIMNYDDLLKVFEVSSKVPSNLPHKFPNITTVTCEHVIDDVDHFFKFLKSLKNLCSLHLNCRSLTNQHHYDQLSESCPKLINLFLKNIDESAEIDFNFILKFDYLTHLDLDKNLDEKIIESLFTDLKYFDRFSFIHHGVKRRRVRGIEKSFPLPMVRHTRDEEFSLIV